MIDVHYPRSQHVQYTLQTPRARRPGPGLRPAGPGRADQGHLPATGTPSLPAFAPWIIAKEKGYYQAQDLDLTFIAAKGGVDVAKQIGAGNALVGGAIGDTPIIVRPNGIPVRTVAVLGGGG